MLLSETQPMPRLVASIPHRFEAVTQHGRKVIPETIGTGHVGASGGAELQVPPLSVPQVPVIGFTQHAGGSMNPGT